MIIVVLYISRRSEWIYKSNVLWWNGWSMFMDIGKIQYSICLIRYLVDISSWYNQIKATSWRDRRIQLGQRGGVNYISTRRNSRILSGYFNHFGPSISSQCSHLWWRRSSSQTIKRFITPHSTTTTCFYIFCICYIWIY